MKAVEEIIGNLLLQHNCVIVPSFGGFVAKQVSAQIDYASGVMTPPRKSLLFNKQLINNDGLLVAEFARENNTSYDEANEVVKDLVSSWHQQMQAGNRVTIDRVGFLFFDQEKNICFEQDRYFNLLLASFGLGKVHFLTETDVEIAKIKVEKQPLRIVEQDPPAIEQVQTKAIAQPKTIEDTPVVPLVPKVEPSRKTPIWKYVAAACVLPLAFYSVWIPMKTDVLESKLISLHDFNPFHKTPASVYNAEKMLDVKPLKGTASSPSLNDQLQTVSGKATLYSYNFSDDTFIAVELSEQANGNIPAQNETVVSSDEGAVVVPHSYHFIVGCFSDGSNASNLVHELNQLGFNAIEVDVKGGLHRVSCGGSFSRAGLQSIIEKAESTGLEGWILKK